MAERKINGTTYRAEPMLATKALMLQARIGKAVGVGLAEIGPVVAGLAKGSDGKVSLTDSARAAAVGVLSKLFAGMDEQEAVSIMVEMAEQAQIKRPSGYEQISFDNDFTQRPGDLFPVLALVAEEAFGPFFAGLRGSGPRKVAGG